ncbi:hypothetical protein ABZ816_40910 [Actinosynnema sp. NPDC047251]|uniref:hypothetical protein n=1 Tax=Saccharothrix espanaensis TaxID=103731 RepID=UPI00059CFD09|nr:hypothetical protein [Saccharothrix espanaensis]
MLLGLTVACESEPAMSPVPVAAGSSTASPAAARLVTQPKSAKAGDEVRLSGEGYPANSRVVFTFHGQRVGDAATDGAGRFAGVLVKVPDSFQTSAPGTQFVIGATSGPYYAETPFVITR